MGSIRFQVPGFQDIESLSQQRFAGKWPTVRPANAARKFCHHDVGGLPEKKSFEEFLSPFFPKRLQLPEIFTT